MKYTSIVCVVIIILLSSACKENRIKTTGQIPVEKQRIIASLLFLPDLEKIPLDKMEKTDTLFRSPLNGIDKDRVSLFFTTSGDCSYCIVDAIDFLKSWNASCVEKGNLPAFVLKGGKEIFTYYLEKELLKERSDIEIDNLLIIEVPNNEITIAKDGIYVTYKGRVINYAPWKE